ncbi:ATP-dependent Clp protease ATP-binding subunit [Candidatus Saccharibacteria bacterium]|nr:ATP-dependent Clp protease ATP-binding subunit [Candidatus Saccharibacteria bacterium]
MVAEYHYHSVRAKEARLARALTNRFVRVLIGLIGFGLIGLGAAFIIFKDPVAWVCLGCAIIPFMVLFWIKNELTRIPIGKHETINDVLSGNSLSLLGAHPTPQSLVGMFRKTKSGVFMMTRFGIREDVLASIAGQLTQDINPVFEKALAIRKETNSEQINGGILMVALIECYPEHENLLKQMKMEVSDLHQGIIWYNYLYGLVAGAKAPRRSGGIARDFSFGFIPTLQRYGKNISKEREVAAKTQILQGARQEIINKMVETFSKSGRQNIALVGPYGSGRTTIVNAFAEILLDADSNIPSNLKFRQVFALDATALIGSAKERGDLETLVVKLFNEAYAAKNIIICLDNAHLFFEDGTGSADISNVLLPILDAGKTRIILEMDQQKFLEISAKNGALANTLNKITVEPANEEETLKILQDQIPVLEYQHHVVYTYFSLLEAYKMSDRYIHDVEMPGKAKILLESAASYAENGLVTEKSVQMAIEKTEGVKVQVASNEADTSRLLNLEELIHQRMIDQVEAVKTVSDALRRAAAGVRNTNRPIGTFLFLGPTGVGKTELAKALSEVYFNGESQIVRLDLNEFVSASDVNRLIADGAEDALSLTAQVMKKPFSVVLLDEIEKAHPQVLTTLLQLLDEGILRDAKNREVSFRDCIVIATSNAGAELIRQYITSGHNLADFKDQFTDNLISSGQFKPEFLNRFDEICLFKPLSKEDLVQVIDLILNSVNKELASRKITVSLAEDAKALLVERGYDPRLGARPMRRIVQKTVENLVARAVLSGEIAAGSAVNITREQIEEQLK